MNYIDMHCDTLAKAAAQQKKTAGELRNTMVDAKRLHQCGAKAQFFAMFLQQKREENWSDPGLAYTEKNNLWYTDAEIRKQMQDTKYTKIPWKPVRTLLHRLITTKDYSATGSRKKYQPF